MTAANTRPTRRRLLGATAAAVLGTTPAAGCDGGDPPPDPARDPLYPLYRQALELAAGLQRAAAAQPALAARLTPLADDHRAHAAELARLIGVTGSAPPPSAPPSAPPVAAGGDAAAVLARLRTAEQTAQRDAAAACRNAPADRAALLGSVAACRATHAEALRRGAP